MSAAPGLALALTRFQIGEHGLAADGVLTDGDERHLVRRQIDVDAAAETDQADALAHREDVARLDERHDAPGHQSGDLPDEDRTVERAERVYTAMLSRGFTGDMPSMRRRAVGAADLLFLALVIASLAVFRLVPLPEIIGRLLQGGRG